MFRRSRKIRGERRPSLVFPSVELVVSPVVRFFRRFSIVVRTSFRSIGRTAFRIRFRSRSRSSFRIFVRRFETSKSLFRIVVVVLPSLSFVFDSKFVEFFRDSSPSVGFTIFRLVVFSFVESSSPPNRRFRSRSAFFQLVVANSIFSIEFERVLVPNFVERRTRIYVDDRSRSSSPSNVVRNVRVSPNAFFRSHPSRRSNSNRPLVELFLFDFEFF